jgi:hypothetical protein
MKYEATTRIASVAGICQASESSVRDAAAVHSIRVMGGLLMISAGDLTEDFCRSVREIDVMNRRHATRMAARASLNREFPRCS